MESLQNVYNQVLQALPGALGALVLFLVALALASLARMLVVKLIHSINVTKHTPTTNTSGTNIAKPIGDIVYFLVLLVFLPGILSRLGLDSMLTPLVNMTNSFLAAIPGIVGAAIILFIGIFVARLIQSIIQGVLSPLDYHFNRLNLPANTSISKMLGLLAYVVVLIPVIVAALKAVGMSELAQPVQSLLDRFLGYIPSLLAATLLLGITYYVGRLITTLISSFLAGLGFDRIPHLLGLGPIDTDKMQQRPSTIAGNIIFIALMLLTSVQALQMLKLNNIADMLSQFVFLGGNILLGLIILAVGLYLGNLFAKMLAGSGMGNSQLLANAARITTLVLFGAMALNQMGLAPEIVNVAFELILGAVAVAFALAFGLGGREAAGKVAEYWRQQLQKYQDGSN